MAELMARTVSAALHRLGFNPVSKRSTFDGITVSGKGRVRVSATWADLDFAWEMVGECADALEAAGWTVERREAPAMPGLYVTAAPVRGGKREEASMTVSRGVPAIGDVVTVSGEHVSDGVTRVGIVVAVSPYSQQVRGHLLTLRSVRVDTTWVDTWDPDTMVVARVGDCGHEVTGGYVYTGDPAGSRSMDVTVRYPGESRTVPAIDGEGLWVTVLDEEGMECELQVAGLTLPLMRTVIADTDRYEGRGEKYSPAEESPMSAMGLLRACMARYLDISGGTGLHGRTSTEGVSDMLHHMAMITRDVDDVTATEWLGEELQEMLAARG